MKKWLEYHAERQLREGVEDQIHQAYGLMKASDQAKVQKILSSATLGQKWVDSVNALLKGKESWTPQQLVPVILTGIDAWIGGKPPSTKRTSGRITQAATQRRMPGAALRPSAAVPTPPPRAAAPSSDPEDRLAQFRRMAGQTSTNPIGTGTATPEQMAQGKKDREGQQIADKLKDIGALVSNPQEIAALKRDRQIAADLNQALMGQHKAYYTGNGLVRLNPHYQAGGAYA